MNVLVGEANWIRAVESPLRRNKPCPNRAGQLRDILLTCAAKRNRYA